jgi:hypothetical protein
VVPLERPKDRADCQQQYRAHPGRDVQEVGHLFLWTKRLQGRSALRTTEVLLDCRDLLVAISQLAARKICALANALMHSRDVSTAESSAYVVYCGRVLEQVGPVIAAEMSSAHHVLPNRTVKVSRKAEKRCSMELVSAKLTVTLKAKAGSATREAAPDGHRG